MYAKGEGWCSGPGAGKLRTSSSGRVKTVNRVQVMGENECRGSEGKSGSRDRLLRTVSNKAGGSPGNSA